MKFFGHLLCALLALILCSRGADDESPNIIADVQMAAVPRTAAVPLIHDLRDSAKAPAAFAKIQQLIDAGTAKLIDWPLIITRSGQRAQIENIREIRYPTEFDAGGTAIHLFEKNGLATKVPKTIAGVESNPVPTSFETRNAGTSFEVEPVLSADGKTIHLNLTPQHVRFRGMRRDTIEMQKTGNKVITESPDFETRKTQTSLTLRNGQRVLLGIFPTDDPPDHIELFILKAETQAP